MDEMLTRNHASAPTFHNKEKEKQVLLNHFSSVLTRYSHRHRKNTQTPRGTPPLFEHLLMAHRVIKKKTNNKPPHNKPAPKKPNQNQNTTAKKTPQPQTTTELPGLQMQRGLGLTGVIHKEKQALNLGSI